MCKDISSHSMEEDLNLHLKSLDLLHYPDSATHAPFFKAII